MERKRPTPEIGQFISLNERTSGSAGEVAMMESNALALEYQAEYGSAGRDVDIANLVNNPNASRIVCVFGPGLLEESANVPFVQRGVFAEQVADALLIRTLP